MVVFLTKHSVTSVSRLDFSASGSDVLSLGTLPSSVCCTIVYLYWWALGGFWFFLLLQTSALNILKHNFLSFIKSVSVG